MERKKKVGDPVGQGIICSPLRGKEDGQLNFRSRRPSGPDESECNQRQGRENRNTLKGVN